MMYSPVVECHRRFFSSGIALGRRGSKVADATTIFFQKNIIVIVSVRIAADENFRFHSFFDRVLYGTGDDGIDDEHTGNG